MKIPHCLNKTQQGIHIELRLQPRSTQNKIALQKNGTLKAWVKNPPIDSAANIALIKLLSSILKIPKKNIRIIRGQTSRSKLLLITEGDFFEICELVASLSSD